MTRTFKKEWLKAIKEKTVWQENGLWFRECKRMPFDRFCDGQFIHATGYEYYDTRNYTYSDRMGWYISPMWKPEYEEE